MRDENERVGYRFRVGADQAAAGDTQGSIDDRADQVKKPLPNDSLNHLRKFSFRDELAVTELTERA